MLELALGWWGPQDAGMPEERRGDGSAGGGYQEQVSVGIEGEAESVKS